MARVRAVLLGVALCVLMACVPGAGGTPARASEGWVSYDCTDDDGAYAETVAVLNRCADRQIEPEQGTDGRLYGGGEAAAPLFAVLCRTQGGELAPVPEGLVCVAAGPDHCYTLYYSSRAAADSAVARYRRAEGMVYAEPDAEVAAAMSQATLLPESAEAEESREFHSWGASRMRFDRYIGHAARWGQGAATVAVIDSGVCRHPFLEGRLTESGYDYIDADDDATNDTFGHGTHVAGIIADCTVEVPVSICPIRVLNSSGSGKISNVVNAIREAVGMGVDVINLSIESRVLSEALDSAILEAMERGTVVVVAAGNSGCDTVEVCPAHLKDRGVVVVGGAALNGDACARAAYSNYGESVDAYAFGSKIVSCSITGGYVEDTGTSMAAPHVSALCAMLRLIHPGLSPALIEERVVSAASLDGALFVPDLESMVPASEGLRLRVLKLREAETIQLPTAALPATSREAVAYAVDDPSVASLADGLLTAKETGTARVTVSCTGFDDATFEVVVGSGGESADLYLPEALSRLEDGAFAGDAGVERVLLPEGLSAIGSGVFEGCAALRTVRIPATVDAIGDNTFSDAVVICKAGSAAHDYCRENGIQYVTER